MRVSKPLIDVGCGNWVGGVLKSMRLGAQTGPWGWGSHPPQAQAFPKLSETVGAVVEGEHGSLKALQSPCFVKEFPWLLYRVCAATCDHSVACFGFPSAQVKPSSQGSLWGWHIVSGNDSYSCCMAHLLLSRCKIKHRLLALSWPRLMLLFWGFMSETQKTWKSRMEKTYEIIPSTHRVVPCKIFSIILSKAIKIHCSERDTSTSPGELLHLPGCQGGLIHPQSTVQS